MAKKTIEQEVVFVSRKGKEQKDISILNTNSAKIKLEEDYDQPLSKQQKLKIVAVVSAVVAFIAALLIVGGIFSKKIEQKRWLRQPDESMSAFYAEETQAAITSEEIGSIITQVYYTNEKGMQISLNFSNGLNKKQRITKIYITIRDEDENGEIIAKGSTDEISKKTVIPSGENIDFELYIPPRYVANKEHSLKTIHYDITLEYVAVE